jgi:NAD(P)-dependent dehydrogenase (short-subunit alcohol dehydrogenase family)
MTKVCAALEDFFGLDDKVVFVTGGAGQIGKALISKLLVLGAKVVATDKSENMIREAANKGGWHEKTIVLGRCDIRERSSIKEIIEVGTKQFGGIDALVNNAGVSVFEPYLERDESSIEWVMNVNLKGTILCTQEFIKHRTGKGGGGSVVNIASHYGFISPDPRIYTDCARKNSEIYGATKAGIIQMTRYFAVHAAEHDIRVNAVSPGGIRNPDNPQGQDFQINYGFRCPMGRMAETEEITGSILFLMSPAASYINGHNLVIDGGMSAW